LGYGAGGAGGGITTSGNTTRAGAAGYQGLIVVTYTPGRTGNFFFMF
jgi:hypothetical protein